MTDITFYLIDSDHLQQRFRAVCQIAEKAYAHHHTAYIILEDTAMAVNLDHLLWTYKDNAFLPHDMASACTLIVKPHPQSTATDILINLTETIPPTYQQFNRIIEIINQEPSIKQQGRKRYQYYKDQGYAIVTHRLAK